MYIVYSHIYVYVYCIFTYTLYINHIFYLPTIIQKLGSAFWDLGTTRRGAPVFRRSPALSHRGWRLE